VKIRRGMKIRVVFKFDEKDLGEKWMNIDNLKLLLYSKGFATTEKLFRIESYSEDKESK